jgi:hypothetical protein
VDEDIKPWLGYDETAGDLANYVWHGIEDRKIHSPCCSKDAGFKQTTLLISAAIIPFEKMKLKY